MRLERLSSSQILEELLSHVRILSAEGNWEPLMGEAGRRAGSDLHFRKIVQRAEGRMDWKGTKLEAVNSYSRGDSYYGSDSEI